MYMNPTPILFDPTVWGPHYWFFLHTIAMIYPNHPNSETKKMYYQLIHQFHHFIPIQEMANQYESLMDLYPIQPYLENKESLLKWMHFIHNHYNQQLKKSTVSYSDFYSQYYELYNQPKHCHVNQLFYRSILKKLIQISVIGMIIYCILFLM